MGAEFLGLGCSYNSTRLFCLCAIWYSLNWSWYSLCDIRFRGMHARYTVEEIRNILLLFHVRLYLTFSFGSSWHRTMRVCFIKQGNLSMSARPVILLPLLAVERHVLVILSRKRKSNWIQRKHGAGLLDKWPVSAFLTRAWTFQHKRIATFIWRWHFQRVWCKLSILRGKNFLNVHKYIHLVCFWKIVQYHLFTTCDCKSRTKVLCIKMYRWVHYNEKLYWSFKIGHTF